jgi:hypothetical protein
MLGPLGQAAVGGMRYLWEICPEGRFTAGLLDGRLACGGGTR